VPLAGNDAPTVVTAVPVPLTVTEILRPSKFETPQPFTVFSVRKQYAPVVLKLPDCPPVLISVQLPPPELELLEEDELELLEPLDELDELLEELDELELLLDEELLDDELELLDEELLELDEEELELLELLDEELDELLLDEPPTVTVKPCMLCAPQVLVWVAVAVQLAVGDTVCSRAVPDVPHPVQLQEPPDAGCGPNCTELPAVMLTLEVCCQVPALTRR
jgi:hypothetical protein